jgi:hypothetical protein
MAIITEKENTFEIDFYGRIIGTDIETEIATSIGLMGCILRRRLSGKEIVIEADLWQSGHHLRESSFTTFRAVVSMRREGRQWRIIDHAYRGVNQLWIELENIVSNLIAVNE